MAVQSKPEVFYTKHQAGLTMIVDGVPAVVDKSNPHFDAIEAALKAGKYERVVALANLKQTVVQAFAEAGADNKLRIRDGQVFWSGPKGEEQVQGPLVDRIVATVRNGSTAQAIQPLVRLLTNISRNKRKDLREEMYQFFMSGKMPITQDGCFLAYKKVKKNFKDIYTGTMDNSPGKLVAMPEEQVNTDRHQTCSVGLHFCSRSYLSQYSGSDSKIVVVKVNPRFVFAIPTDYNFAKGRASEYYVVGEVTGDAYKDEMFLSPFIYNDNVKEAAPQVKFVKGETVTINNLKPSLKTMAEGYGLSSNGKAFVRTSDTKGDLVPEKYTIVKPAGNGTAGYISAITAKPVPEEHVKSLSIQTKSVRAALVRAVARRRNKGA